MSGKHHIEFDHVSFSFSQATVSVWRLLKGVLVYVLGTLTVAVLVFAAISLIFSTDAEKRMRQEIRMYKQVFSDITPKADLLGDAVTNLQFKDDELYEMVFSSHSPAVDPLGASRVVFASDTLPDSRLLSYAQRKSEALMSKADSIETAFRKVMEILTSGECDLPPVFMPLEKITFSQTGASTGRRINPLYKAYTYHNGLDLIVPRGTPVLAAADGTVRMATNEKSLGNIIKIEHAGGYETQYLHLESMSVRPGQKVRRGDRIGTVGMSGNAYAPHLHYTMLKDGVTLDPVHYIFASLPPEEFANMLYMSVNTLQSMD